MSGGLWRAYRDEVLTNLGRPAYTYQTVPKTLSAWTEYIPLSPRAGDPVVLGVWAECVVTATNGVGTATAQTSITVGPATTTVDGLDLAFDQVQVAPSPASQARSYSQSRMFQEEVERIVLDAPKIFYPRPAVANMTSSSVVTTTQSIFIPVGGGAGALRFHVAPITNVFTTGVTSSVVFNCYVISGSNDTLWTFLETPTGSLGSGQQDLSLLYPNNLSPDYLFALNETSTSITRFYQTTQDNDILIDAQDQTILAAAQVGMAPEVVFLPQATTLTLSPGYNSMVFAQEKKRFKTIQMSFLTGAAHQFGFLEGIGTQTVNPPVPAASTPATPASSSPGTGSVGAGGMPAAKTGGGPVGGRSNVRRVGK